MPDGGLPAAMRGLIAWASLAGASDLHLSAGTPPFVRRNRELEVIDPHPLTDTEALRLNCALLSDAQKADYLEKRDLDLALDPGGDAGRCRVNLMFHKKGAAGAYRLVPARSPTLAGLGFGPHQKTIDRLLSYHNGLVLVTGPVGSGKTTTLAAMLAQLNGAREDHIITVEDPIEFIHAAGRCNVTQRQVGDHTRTFHSALKGALREDPDVIAIGELRDLETIEMAVSAAETGHLVLATMHTSDAATTLNRILDVFPPGQQAQIRASVAESLRGIICQRLLPRDGGGLTLACEILVNTTAIANLIREGKTTGLRNSMETGVREGMCLMDNVVFALWQQREITAATALSTITNRVLRARIT